MTKLDKTLKDLYQQRKGAYIKKADDEKFLQNLNDTLAAVERPLYRDLPIEHPFIFIFGLPRSGTTLVSQLLAHCLDVGYINNFMARFYLAPLHGIRLSRLIFGDERSTAFQSDYARTSELTDIHEFGYFWRHWLKKEHFSGVTRAAEVEKEIEWEGLKTVLANIQAEFDKPMVFKNIFGSYHLRKLNQTLGKVIYVYIKRDPLDAAVSILDARRKYYTDPNTWWSYMPVEYEQLKDLDYWRQIAGQVYYLKRYYDDQTQRQGLANVLEVEYETLTRQPAQVLEMVTALSSKLYTTTLNRASQPPENFPFRTYTSREADKDRFQRLINEFKEKQG